MSDLHLEWHPEESAEEYWSKYVSILDGFRSTDYYKALMDLLDARERDIWTAFKAKLDATPDELKILQVRQSEAATIRELIKDGTEYLTRKRESDAARARTHAEAQMRRARTVDKRLESARALKNEEF